MTAENGVSWQPIGSGMRRVFDIARRVAPTDATVLIEGECGTCKELVAETIHACSRRHVHPLARMNCGAAAEASVVGELTAAIECAGNGTLLITDVEKLSVPAQAHLVDLLQRRSLGTPGEPALRCRVLATTAADLRRRVEVDAFRADLHCELCGVTLLIPPLRERKQDILAIARRLLADLTARHARDIDGFSGSAVACLSAYPWPCNDRELERIIEGAVVLARSHTIEPGDLPDTVRQDAAHDPRPCPEAGAVIIPPRTTLAQAERLLIDDALTKTGGNKQQAARLLGIAVRTIHRKLGARPAVRRPEPVGDPLKQ